MTARLRSLTTADGPAAAALHALGFPDPWSADAITAQIAAPGALALGLEADGRLIGFGLFQSAAGDSELLTIAVHPAWRGQGHARCLADAAIALLAGAGNTRLLLDVAEDNIAARALYARLGFTEDGRRKGYYTVGRARPADAILMSRPLDGWNPGPGGI